MNTIGPKVDLTPGSISVAVDRLHAKGLVTRIESEDDRRIRIVELTPCGRKLISAVFKKHSAAMEKVFSGLSPKCLEVLEGHLKAVGRRAEQLQAEHEKATD